MCWINQSIQTHRKYYGAKRSEVTTEWKKNISKSKVSAAYSSESPAWYPS